MARKYGARIALALVTLLGERTTGLAGETAEGPSPTGVYTSAIYESEAAMLRGESGSKHVCVWKGREKKKGKVICTGNVQLKCGQKGWYKLGPC